MRARAFVAFNGLALFLISAPQAAAQVGTVGSGPSGLSTPPVSPRTASATDFDRQSPSNDTAIGSGVPSFSQLFRAVGQDFKNLPSSENALLLGIGAGLAGLSKPAELDITEDWTRVGPEDKLLKPGAIMGNSYLHLAGAFALYTAGRVSHNGRVGAFGADLVRAQILAQSTTFALKFAADRTRPNGEARSFPSGHTSTMFATATVVQQHFGWKAGVPAFAAAAYVGASRIDANKHYLSDVAFGAALGIIAGRTVTLGTSSMKFALTPVGGPGGGVGIGLTRVK
jgi:membrane-associated phospholipid phosphatase